MADKYVPIFYDWPEATQELNDQEKGRLIDALVIYARGGDWQERIKGNERYAFPMFRLQIDRAKNISSIRATARTNKTEQNEQTATNGTNDNIIPNNNNNKNNNKNEEENKNNKKGSDIRARTRFNPPTVDEVKAYATEKGYTLDAERFVAYYESNGWRVGKNPMKDWQAAVRNWATRDKQEGKTYIERHPQENPALQYKQRDYTGSKPKAERVYMTFDD